MLAETLQSAGRSSHLNVSVHVQPRIKAVRDTYTTCTIFISSKKDKIIPQLHTSYASVNLIMISKHSKSPDHSGALELQL